MTSLRQILVDTRQTLAEALSDVIGVVGYPYRPTTPQVGDAWPLLGPLERADGFAFYVSWRVLVFLGGDETYASQWIDEHLDGLIEGISPVAYVDGAQPVQLSSASGNAFGFQINVRSE
jgi:hypothetical protein